MPFLFHFEHTSVSSFVFSGVLCSIALHAICHSLEGHRRFHLCQRFCLPPLSLCVIYFQCTVHESLGRVYACVLLPVCSIQPTVMCWEALIEYTIWREPRSHLLETQPARKMHCKIFKTANILEFVQRGVREFGWQIWMSAVEGCQMGSRQALTTIWE